MSNLPVNDRPFPLLKLPRELRDEICQYVLCLNGLVQVLSVDFELWDAFGEAFVSVPNVKHTYRSTWIEKCPHNDFEECCHGMALGIPKGLWDTSSEVSHEEDSDVEDYEEQVSEKQHSNGKGLGHNGNWRHSTRFTYTTPNFRDKNLSILETCRQMYDEGTDVLYGKNAFSFKRETDDYPHLLSELPHVTSHVLRAFIQDRSESSQRKFKHLELDLVGSMKEPQMLQVIADSLTLRLLRIDIVIETPPLPTEAGGLLDTLWQYFLPQIPSLSVLNLGVRVIFIHECGSLRCIPRGNLEYDSAAATVAAIVKRISGVNIETDMPESNAIYHVTGNRSFAAFGKKPSKRKAQWIQFVAARRSQLNATQEQVLDNEGLGTAGPGNRRAVWVTEKVAKILKIV
ncbi:hypothetical protein NA57DRAFT_56934 [Rhizodiscina lignyota]|uniref:DUF7730 domain-containing protein n=1 Tax=Rhizodiscina lignyota TaxID=1504668 RepID=A0A9P4M5E8_9PEZI|nr:hypothetical protein NA57DRAFT_56934 [Rhizodiscina lignyota]